MFAPLFLCRVPGVDPEPPDYCVINVRFFAPCRNCIEGANIIASRRGDMV